MAAHKIDIIDTRIELQRLFRTDTDCTIVRLYDCTIVRLYDCTIVRLYDCTTVRPTVRRAADCILNYECSVA